MNERHYVFENVPNGKYYLLTKLVALSTENLVISALAIDLRDSLKKMLGSEDDTAIEEFKVMISENLTPYSSSILLGSEYGLPATKARAENAGLILAYEETGYDASSEERYPDLLDNWSALRNKEVGADAVEILLHYDIDAGAEIYDIKHAFVERVGSECEAEDIPYSLEILTYDTKVKDVKSKEYVALKPRKVNEAMNLFSEVRYKVDVLKVEVPVNMNYVQGFSESDDVIHTQVETKQIFKFQSDSTDLPFILLSAGVLAKLFQDNIVFAGEADSTFNVILCGRATLKESTDIYASETDSEHTATKEWLQTTGRYNIEELNAVLNQHAVSWANKVQVK